MSNEMKPSEVLQEFLESDRVHKPRAGDDT